MPRFPARLHVLLARDAPIGLVIRRGPSKQVCTVLWNRKEDAFERGQWLKGRIYERRCDLTVDGRYFIYFAMNGRWESEVKGSWTAISKAPYLKAIALFPKGDCWHGGGLFTGKHFYWLNDGCGHEELATTKEFVRDETFRPVEYYGGECPGVYYPRLLRDGWELVRSEKPGEWSDLTVFEKPLIKGWILRKLAHGEVGAPPGKGCYWDEHELLHTTSGKRFSFPAWEWADIDGKRLVWASDGKLYAARLTVAGLINEHELYDFNDMKFERIEAPY
jgi:hypothetical protein